MDMHKEYCTYGFGNKFDKDKIVIDLKTRGSSNKPMSAWWGSPVDAKFGWKDWCLAEEWFPKNEDPDVYLSESNKINWTLEDSANILTISSLEDLQEYFSKGFIIARPGFFMTCYEFDFQEILDKGYAAVELLDPTLGHLFINELELMLNSWDCESIVVLDPTKIIWK